jgi:thiol-disulfide isomerase/thioredoxin
MNDTQVPQFFAEFPMHQADSASLDGLLADASRPLSLLFLWGRDCPNCDIAKRAILRQRDRFDWEEIRWLHCNVYDDPQMATRFGLHGIPTFMLFRGKVRLGRISPWPGADAFCAAIARQISALDGAPG